MYRHLYRRSCKKLNIGKMVIKSHWSKGYNKHFFFTYLFNFLRQPWKKQKVQSICLMKLILYRLSTRDCYCVTHVQHFLQWWIHRLNEGSHSLMILIINCTYPAEFNFSILYSQLMVIEDKRETISKIGKKKDLSQKVNNFSN